MNRLQCEGVSYKDIGEKFSCTQSSITKCLKKYGFKKERRLILQDEDIDSQKVINLYDSGRTLAEIGKVFHIGSARVKRILEKNNITLNVPFNDEQIISEMQKMFEYEGTSLRLIGEKFGITRKIMTRLKRQNNWKRINPYKSHEKKKRLPWREGWIKEYGKEKGEAMWLDYKMRQRKNNEGKNNSMYGKPSPMGSGYGIKGWHKGRFFRSLRELSFMLNYIDRFGLKEESLEKRKYRIPYIDPMGIDRTYAGDFLINNKFFVEIKPKRLWESPSVKAKAEAGVKFCEEQGWKYKLIDPIVKNDQVVKEYLAGNIKFNEKSLEKFLEFNNLKSSTV